MRVALFGGTGFVGSYLTDALVNAGMTPVVLVRPGSESRVRHPDRCRIVRGEVADSGAVADTLANADAVIYNIGILRESASRGVTFEALHFRAPRRIMDAAEQLGIRRFLLMSANGVRADGTPYQRTKYRAERHLAETALDWTVFRPSVIFGDPRGRTEFASQLKHDIIDPPWPAPLFHAGLWPRAAGGFQLSPVHVEDVAEAFVRVLSQPAGIRDTLHLGGPASLTWRAILETVAGVAGRSKLMVPVPALGVSAVAALLDRFEAFPVTRDQLKMLLEGNTCGSGYLERLGIRPRPFDRARLAYLGNSAEHEKPSLKNAA